MFNPHKGKYHDLYMDIACRVAQESYCERHKVGAVVVTPTGMISVGYNGMPSGLPNKCENEIVFDVLGKQYRPKTDPRVIHAEQNALDKMANQGIPVAGSLLFVTLSPCFECAKKLINLDLKHIYYKEYHDCTKGLELFNDVGIKHCLFA